MMARRKYVVGNWKMNGLTEALGEAGAIFAAARGHDVDVALCPPFTLIGAMAVLPEGGVVGGQDCHAQASGACTGSVSAPMLADAGARLVIVGHSERRENFGERSEEHTSELQSLMRISYAVFRLQKKNT